jgi:hypothetical protein
VSERAQKITIEKRHAKEVQENKKLQKKMFNERSSHQKTKDEIEGND